MNSTDLSGSALAGLVATVANPWSRGGPDSTGTTPRAKSRVPSPTR